MVDAAGYCFAQHGIVSIGDVVKARITQQEHEVDTLKAYVAGV